MSKNLELFLIGRDLSASRALKDLGREADHTGHRLGGIGTAAKVGLGIAAVGIGAVGAALAYGLKQAIDYEKITAQTGAVLKSTGGVANVTAKDVDNLAGSVEGYSTFSREAVASAENLLLTFTNVRNEAGKGNDVFDRTIKTAANLATAFHTDLPSATKILGKALQDPEHGLSRLQRIGIVFTQKQKDQIKALQDSGHAMEAQKLILDSLSQRFGGSAKAAGETFAGSLTRLKNTAKDAFRELATPVLPALTKGLSLVADAATKYVAPAFKAAQGAVSDFIHGFTVGVDGLHDPQTRAAQAGAVLYGVWAQKILPVLRQAIPIIEQVAHTIGSGLAKVLPVIANIVENHVIPAFQTIVRIFRADVLPVLEAVFTWVATKLAPALGKIIVVAVDAFRGALKHIQSAIDAHRKQLTEVFNAIRTLANFILAVAVPVIKVALKVAFAILGTAISIVITVIAGMVTAIHKFIDVAKTVVRVIFDFIVTPLGWIVHAAASAFGWVPGLGGKLKKARREFDDFVRGVNAALSNLHDKTIKVDVVGRVKNANGSFTSGFGSSGVVDGLRGAASVVPSGSVHHNYNVTVNGIVGTPTEAAKVVMREVKRLTANGATLR